MNNQNQKSSPPAKPTVRDIPAPASVVPRNPPGEAPQSDEAVETRRTAKPEASPLAPRSGQLSPPVEGS